MKKGVKLAIYILLLIILCGATAILTMASMFGR